MSESLLHAAQALRPAIVKSDSYERPDFEPAPLKRQQRQGDGDGMLVEFALPPQ